MTNPLHESGNDEELQSFLNECDDSHALSAIASRVAHFADDEVLPSGFADAVRRRAAIQRPHASRAASRRFARWAAAAAFLIAGMGIGNYLAHPGNAPIAWGDVVTAMEPVDYFHVAVFVDNSAFFNKSEAVTSISLSQANHFDFYYRKPNLWRAQNDEGIQFTVGQKTSLYSTRLGKFVESSNRFPGFIIPDLFASAVQQKGPLDALLGVIFAPHSPPAGTPVVDSALSDSGIQVFDYKSKNGEGPSARIWVVQKTRLPIRLQVDDSTSGPFMWATLDYSDPKPASFFDVAAFENNLKTEGPPTTRHALDNHFVLDDILAWHKVASTSQEPPGTLKYSEVAADLKGPRHDRMLRINGQPLPVAHFNIGPAERLPLYNGNGNRILSETPCVFVHELTARLDGSKRLITVEFTRLDDLGTAFNVHQIEARANTFAIRSGALFPLKLNDLAAPGQLRMFAGQADPTDPSHFTIPFEANGKSGVIDAVYLGEQKDGSGVILNQFMQFTVRLKE